MNTIGLLVVVRSARLSRGSADGTIDCAEAGRNANVQSERDFGVSRADLRDCETEAWRVLGHDGVQAATEREPRAAPGVVRRRRRGRRSIAEMEQLAPLRRTE